MSHVQATNDLTWSGLFFLDGYWFFLDLYWQKGEFFGDDEKIE
jgi:hypothetical protein